jgi:hypothetical protein
MLGAVELDIANRGERASREQTTHRAREKLRGARGAFHVVAFSCNVWAYPRLASEHLDHSRNPRSEDDFCPISENHSSMMFL